ncbi:hypothetical protein [Nocardioides sp.]|uniref:hypothetical protein n=1 Tax=Nocardioides sp. TaxID=35761 RepID=UPI0037850361
MRATASHAVASVRSVAVVVATTVAVVLLPLAMAPSEAVTDGGRAAPRTYWASSGSGSYPVYRPRILYVSGDGTLMVKPARWSSWTATRAVGHGIAWVTRCTPDCASGPIAKRPARIVLYRATDVCGHRFFTGFKLVYRNGQVYRWDPYYIAC